MVIVDAFNVLHAARVGGQSGVALDLGGLARLIGRGRYANQVVVLVCDGGSGERSLGDGLPPTLRHTPGVHVVYAGPGQEADAAIEALLGDREVIGTGKATLVVSSDRRVRAAAVGARARTVTSDDFLRHLFRDAKANRDRRAQATGDRPAFATDLPLDADATAWWLSQFGVDAEGRPATPVGDLASRAGRAVDRAAAPPVPRPKGRPRPGTAPDASPPPAEPPESEGVPADPVLRAALEEWRGRLRLDDLDMERWLKGAIAPPRPEE